MDLFNIIAGASSIIGLLISLFIASKIIKISNNLKVNNNFITKDMSKTKTIQKRNQIGSESIMSGRDTNVKKPAD